MLKEKIKGIKATLRAWNKDQFEDTRHKLLTIEKELNKIEAEGDVRQLSAHELMCRKKLQEELWLVAQSDESLVRQKARS